jgi:hypothetical protein
VRIFHRGSVAKGVLLADAVLPDGYIVACASMVKVHGRPECLLSHAQKGKLERSAFEVIRTSNPVREGRLTPQLVPLLEHGCSRTTREGRNKMVSLLLALQDAHIHRILELRDSESLSNNQLRTLILELGPSSIAAEMILAGFSAVC